MIASSGKMYIDLLETESNSIYFTISKSCDYLCSLSIFLFVTGAESQILPPIMCPDIPSKLRLEST